MITLLLLMPQGQGFALPGVYDEKGIQHTLVKQVENVWQMLLFIAICQRIQVIFTLLCIFLPTHIYRGN